MSDQERGAEDLRRFYKLSRDMLGVAGFDGRFRQLGEAWERTLGFSREELLGAPYLDFVHPDDREATLAQASALRAGGETIAFENRYRCRDGSYRWIEWSCSPYVADELIYFVARDVTERKLDVSETRRVERVLRAKMALIERQQEVIRALSTPIIEVWEKVLAVPMVGVVHSEQAAEVMENLLERVSRTGSRFALLDLTGVETMDTATAGHLLKLVQALRLLGAEGIITGIQPSVAQTMITLGVDLGGIVTRANLYGGLELCMARARERLTTSR